MLQCETVASFCCEISLLRQQKIEKKRLKRQASNAHAMLHTVTQKYSNQI
jgi:hypothetical protein